MTQVLLLDGFKGGSECKQRSVRPGRRAGEEEGPAEEGPRRRGSEGGNSCGLWSLSERKVPESN